DNSRFELRMMQTPFCVYEDAAAGILSGALFAFVHGTNVEVLLLIEAHADKDAPPQWKCGFARVGSAEMHVLLGDDEVWTVGRAPELSVARTTPTGLIAR
ncbi:MAG: hypothetical protein KDA61_21210, partial [Planctomycetales bacterium]|nr:hypothetical protein [Planctomycetales bacterium]